MNLLAIETSTESCSVALLVGDALLVRSELAPRRHAELLLPMCEAVLAEAGLQKSALQGVAVGCGPGAFTGVRLAISAAQGVALGLDLPVVPVSSLAALALQAPAGDLPVLAVIDARMGEVYGGVFRRTAADALEALADEWVGPPDALQLPIAPGWAVIGTGWGTYPGQLRARLPADPAWVDAVRFPQAAEVARLAAPRLAAGAGVPAAQALPVYLRDKVALTVAEQRAVRGT